MQRPEDIFQIVKKDLQQGKLISISSESSKINFLIKVFNMSGSDLCIGSFPMLRMSLLVSSVTLSHT